jgi:hypothetical protein
MTGRWKIPRGNPFPGCARFVTRFGSASRRCSCTKGGESAADHPSVVPLRAYARHGAQSTTGIGALMCSGSISSYNPAVAPASSPTRIVSTACAAPDRTKTGRSRSSWHCCLPVERSTRCSLERMDINWRSRDARRMIRPIRRDTCMGAAPFSEPAFDRARSERVALRIRHSSLPPGRQDPAADSTRAGTGAGASACDRNAAICRRSSS